MKKLIETLKNSDTAIDTKVGYMAGDYDLEEATLECLDILFREEATLFDKKEAIQIFLHEDITYV